MVIVVSMVAVVSSTPVVPGISGATVIVRIRLRIRVVWPLVVPVRIIIVAGRIGITIAGKPKTESANAGKSGGDLSVSTLPSNESQSAYRQSNQEKLLHRFTSSICFGFCLLFCAGRLPLPLSRNSDEVGFAAPSKDQKRGATFLINQISAIAMCLALRARVHASLGQRPRCSACQISAPKARFICHRLNRTFSPGADDH